MTMKQKVTREEWGALMADLEALAKKHNGLGYKIAHGKITLRWLEVGEGNAKAARSRRR